MSITSAIISAAELVIALQMRSRQALSLSSSSTSPGAAGDCDPANSKVAAGLLAQAVVAARRALGRVMRTAESARQNHYMERFRLHLLMALSLSLASTAALAQAVRLPPLYRPS